MMIIIGQRKNKFAFEKNKYLCNIVITSSFNGKILEKKSCEVSLLHKRGITNLPAFNHIIFLLFIVAARKKSIMKN